MKWLGKRCKTGAHVGWRNLIELSILGMERYDTNSCEINFLCILYLPMFPTLKSRTRFTENDWEADWTTVSQWLKIDHGGEFRSDTQISLMICLIIVCGKYKRFHYFGNIYGLFILTNWTGHQWMKVSVVGSILWGGGGWGIRTGIQRNMTYS